LTGEGIVVELNYVWEWTLGKMPIPGIAIAIMGLHKYHVEEVLPFRFREFVLTKVGYLGFYSFLVLKYTQDMMRFLSLWILSLCFGCSNHLKKNTKHQSSKTCRKTISASRLFTDLERQRSFNLLEGFC